MHLKFTLVIWLICATISYAQTAFTPGNLVVVRVGSTDSVLANRSREVFLEEYSPTGTLVQTIAIPHSGTDKLTIQGTASLEGTLSLSQNKAFLVFGGYDLPLGVGSPASNGTNAQRVIARVNRNGVADLSTKVANANLHGNASFRAVASNDGSGYWTAGGSQGVRYVSHGSNASVLVSNTVTNSRSIKIWGEQLFLTHSSGNTNPRLMTVGTGTPTTEGNTNTGLPGFSTTGAYVDFYFFDRDATEPGDDVVYIADDGAGMRKFSKVGGTWVENGLFGEASDVFRGLTGIVENDTIVLYATRRGGSAAAGGGQIVKIIDSAVYNSPIRASDHILATAATNTAFRGIAFAPTEEALPLKFTEFTGSIVGNAHKLNWKTQNAIDVSHFTIQLSRSNSGQFSNIGTVEALQTSTAKYDFNYLPKQSGMHLYRLQVTDKDGKVYYSPLVTLQAIPANQTFGIYPNPAKGGVITLTHPVAGKQASFMLLQADGKIIMQKNIQEGSKQTTVNAGTLAKGLYRVVYVDETQQKNTAVFLD